MRHLLLLLAAAAPAYAAPAFDVLLPPNATAVFGLRASTLLNLLAQQKETQDLRQQVSALLAGTPFSGFDPFHDIDEVVVAATASGQNPPSLAVVTGRFDAAKLAGGKGRPYRNALLIQDAKAKQVLAVLDPNTLLAGDLPLVKAAIDRAAGNVAAGPLAARIETLRARYDIWAFADHIDAAALSTAPKPLSGLDRLWFGMAFAHNFELAGELHLRSPQDVAAISAILRDFEKQAKAQMAGAAGPNFDVHTTSNSIVVAISLPEDEWKKALQSRLQPKATAKPRIIDTEIHITSTDSPAQPKPQVVNSEKGDTIMVILPAKRQ